MKNINEILKVIFEKIYKNFPKVKLDFSSIEKVGITNEYFIKISNKEVFYSRDFADFLLDLNMNFLWKKGFDNIYFYYKAKEYSMIDAIINLKSSNKQVSCFYNNRKVDKNKIIEKSNDYLNEKIEKCIIKEDQIKSVENSILEHLKTNIIIKQYNLNPVKFLLETNINKENLMKENRTYSSNVNYPINKSDNVYECAA